MKLSNEAIPVFIGKSGLWYMDITSKKNNDVIKTQPLLVSSLFLLLGKGIAYPKIFLFIALPINRTLSLKGKLAKTDFTTPFVNRVRFL